MFIMTKPEYLPMIILVLSFAPLSSLASPLPLQSPLLNAVPRDETRLHSAADVNRRPMEHMLVVIAAFGILFFAIAGSYLYALLEDTLPRRVFSFFAAAPTLPSYSVWANTYYRTLSYFPRPATGPLDPNESAPRAQILGRSSRVFVKIKVNRPAVGPPPAAPHDV